MRKKTKHRHSRKYRPNKIDKQLDEYLCESYKKGTLNIHQEAKRLKISRMSIYRHLHKAGLVEERKEGLQRVKGYSISPIKKKGFWEKIREFFVILFSNSYENMPTLTEGVMRTR